MDNHKSNSPRPAVERTIHDLETLKVLSHPMRTRILQTLVTTPRSVGEIAQELDVPFTRLYYHMNLLEKHGLIHVVETRSLTPAVEEKFYQVTAYMFVVDRALLTVGGQINEVGEEAVLHDALDQTKEDIRHSVRAGRIDLSSKSPDPNALLLRQGFVRLSPARARQLHEQLVRMMIELQAEEDDPDAAYYGLTIAFYPSVFPTLPDGEDAT